MSAGSDQAIADPIGTVVDVVAAIDPTLDREVVRGLVTAVAGGRAKQRRLASALSANADVLRTGRSPAPRAVGDLLIVLRKSGAQTIAAPVCALCGKVLQSFRRRGLDWCCSGSCSMIARPCTSCGRAAEVSPRHNSGNLLCRRCHRKLGDAATRVVAELIATVDPQLAPDIIATAIKTAAPQANQRTRLADALTARPDLLTGAGAHSPVPTVLRLIDYLCARGATGVVRPACPGCHRVMTLSKIVDGARVCRNCCAKSRARPCHRCGARREPAARDEQGQPICAYCLTNAPANREVCRSCGHHRLVAVRTPDGALCGTCRPRPAVLCAICGQLRRCTTSRVTGQPWCSGCRQRRDTCTGCGRLQPVRSGNRGEPLCAACTHPDPSYWRRCPTCADEHTERMWGGPCPRCLLRQRLRDLLADADGTIRPELVLLHDSVAAHDRPESALNWLQRSAVAKLLREVGAGRADLSHARLDQMPDSPTMQHLRSLLVAAGALTPRDEHMTRTERWVATTIAEHPDPQTRQSLQRYAIWFMLRRLRGRTRTMDTTLGQAAAVRCRLRAAIATLNWLTAHGLTLTTCRQRDIDTWLAAEGRPRRFAVTHFLRWAATQQLTTVKLPGTSWTGPVGVMDTERRLKQARQLLHDNTIHTQDRLAGLLVLLYAQLPGNIAKLRVEQVDTVHDQIRLRLGDQPIVLPEPMASLARTTLNTRHRRAIGGPATSAWLFPGLRPGQHISSAQLAQRLRLIGIEPKPSREAALFQLASQVPAVILARMLGINIGVATIWQRVSAGDWTNYPAELTGTGHPSGLAGTAPHTTDTR